MYSEITKCRVCGSSELSNIMSLGEQCFTGVFPKNKNDNVMSGPVDLIKCNDENGCGLLQLKQSYDINQMYGENYGYRSSLNSSMVSHLKNKVKKILDYDVLTRGDLVVDIGSNDATTLKAYPSNKFDLVGIDPTGNKFKKFYTSEIKLIPKFFNAKIFESLYKNRKAKVITSFSMFYDIENPISFAKDINSILHENGIWIFEQSYMPTMLKKNSFDTICHEHLLFYGLKQILWILNEANLKVIDVEFNQINGGSFSVKASKKLSNYKPNIKKIEKILAQEEDLDGLGLKAYKSFLDRVDQEKVTLLNFLKKCKLEGKIVGALGASTKGNVLLQYYNINDKLIYALGEVNQDKFGCFTPGTLIPIISEDELLSSKPDYILILPWHFRNFFKKLPSLKGRNIIFPLPKFKIVKL